MIQNYRGIIISFLQLKGGVGKSTLAENTAVAFAYENNQKIKIIDCDLRQRTSYKWLSRRHENFPNKTSIFCSIQDDNLRPSVVEDSKNYDVLIIDVQGKDSKSLRTALLISDVIYIPFTPSQNDIETIEELSELLDNSKAQNETCKVFYILNNCSTHYLDNAKSNAVDFFNDYKETLIPSTVQISHRKVYQDASLEGLGVIEMSDKKAKEEILKLKIEIEQNVWL
jgi:chromosome partitioning protein